MPNIPSVLLIDDEPEFQQEFGDCLRSEVKKKLFQLDFAASGQQALEIIKKNYLEKRRTLAFIDIILPDITGNRLVDKINTKYTNAQGILISAHKSFPELEEIRKQYSWLTNSLTKPLNKKRIVQEITSFLGVGDLTKFDYGSLDSNTASLVASETTKIKSIMRKTAESIIEIGERLYKVKQILNHGEFMKWVETEIQCDQTTVVNFIKVWQTFGNRKQVISQIGLNVSVLYILSANNTPEEFRAQVFEMAEAGNPPSLMEVKRLKKEYLERQKTKQLESRPPDDKNIQTVNVLTANDAQPVSLSNAHPHQKQQIISIIPSERTQAQFCNLGKHLIYQGLPSAPEFQDRLPPSLALGIGLPPAPEWNQQQLFPIPPRSTIIFQSSLEDTEFSTFRDIIKKSIELYTEGTDTILFSFLPAPELLVLADRLQCHCFVAEPDFQRYQDIISFWNTTM